MLVKKFEADTMAAALKQVKDTLGSEALILSTRTLRKKGLGVLGRQTIEVTAAVESPAMRRTSMAAGGYPSSQTTTSSPALTTSNRVETLEDEIVSLSGRGPQETAAKRSPKVAQQQADELHKLRAQFESDSISQLKAEIEQLKELMTQLAQAQAQPQVSAQQSSAPHETIDESNQARKMTPRPSAPTPIRVQVATETSDPLVEMLEACGIDAESATTIAGYAAAQMTAQQRRDPHLQREFLCAALAGLVQTQGVLWAPGQPQKKVSLIGATGVGKTTTIAKLAAQAMSESGARVALVTIDTYRIAAVEQLKVYGEIMGIPVDVVFSPEQLQETFRRHRDKDLILIDTAGRSPRDEARIDELAGFLGAQSGVENCLVLAAPTADHLQQQSFDAFSKLPIRRLIFTKLDETDRCGCLINLPLRTNLPLGCLTNGQKVPEDILPADPRLVAELVMGHGDDARRIAV